MPWPHEHPERFAAEADGPLRVPVMTNTLAGQLVYFKSEG